MGRVKGLIHYPSLSKWRKVSVLLGVLLIVGSLSPFIPFNQAEDLNQNIRVALFVDNGSGYRNTVPLVSLNSETGIEIKGETGTFQNINEATYIRFSVNQFYLIVGETTSSTEARQISQQLSQKGYENSIISLVKNNTQIFRVITGSEVDAASLAELQLEIKDALNREARVAGPYRVQAGSFSNLDEAKQRVTEIQSADFATYLTQVYQDKERLYQVWVGDEINTDSQAKLQEDLQQAFPNISSQPAVAEEYIVLTVTVLLGSITEEIPYYWISPQRKVTIVPQESGLVPLLEVAERHGRSYRGQIELSQYRNKFTVVNVLPLDHYLYSVVGTEMSSGWPVEALKAQAVMSRNYAYINMKGNKYGIAHLSDTVYEQAYHGYSQEAEDVRNAVDATKGEFLTYKGQVFSTFYYSNAGGMTAQGQEVWGFMLENHTSVVSKDIYPETVQATWYRVQDVRGNMGFVHSEYVDKTRQMTALGFSYGDVNIPSLNYRSGPSTEHQLIGSLKQGERLVIFEEVKQNNAYSWISGPFNAQETMDSINQRSIQEKQPISRPVTSLQVTERGPSGRVMKMEANGQMILISSPDAHRSVFREGGKVSLRSTKFEVESMGEFAVLGAGGNQVNYPQQNGQPAQLHALSPGKSALVNPQGDQFAIINQAKQLRIVSKEPAFRFHGYGFGHGLGASQWGIRAMAGEGYEYHQILQHYFHRDAIIENKY
jgi:stage II sporulation protein D